jgi:hypothetical protein
MVELHTLVDDAYDNGGAACPGPRALDAQPLECGTEESFGDR